MTSSLTDLTTADNSMAKNASNAPPRKRRRRTAVTGAAEDCFTCRKKQVKCDRRRPYCTQCLEMGKDCTGYRTTLTWGVGVASRGKLRGLSLPIANSSKRAPTSNDDGKSHRANTEKAATSPSPVPPQLERKGPDDNFSPPYHRTAELGSTVYPHGSYSPTSPIPIPSQQGRSGWHMSNFADVLDGYQNLLSKATRLQIRPNPLRRIHTTGTASLDEVAYSTPSSAFSDSDYPSPSEFPATPEDYGIPEPLVNSYSESYPCPPPEQLQPVDSYRYVETPRSFPSNTAFSVPEVASVRSTSSNYSMLASSALPTSFSDLLHSHDYTPTNELSHSYPVGQKVDHDYFSDGLSDFSVSVPSTWPALQPTHKNSGLRGLPSRMQFLLGSYSKAVCPLFVASDHERNPYRLHVMAHLNSSLPLQYAVAALVSCHLKSYKADDLSALAMDSFESSQTIPMKVDCPNPEQHELNYKKLATDAFNDALKTSNMSGDESILITLLVLCLLHLSESGFGNFKIGLAGVKKLLSLHKSGAQGQLSETMSWAENWFLWLDILVSAMGDGAAARQSEVLNALDRSAYLGSVEYLANCEGQLYDAVARLKDWSLSLTRLAPSRDFYGGQITSCEPDLAFETSRHFWTPLSKVQSRLKSIASHPNFHEAEADPMILNYTMDCFKNAAAIYAERITRVNQEPSTHIEDIVARSIPCVTGISSSSCINEFILWPLLVIGTECVQEHHRDLFRQRIATATSGSHFFGDFSCVEVLFKVWTLIDLGMTSVNVPVKVRDSWPRLSCLGGRAATWYNAMAILEHSGRS
ncbi:uncharacterized protein PV09_02763 [Verruconis gallopava]|uniref:Zn(2)-C6 fungal-type domain-containing protein n=1 Tax=Verruconis gallopava TaxID=253628 RepID=A0A0D1XU55_9PEZI|nr:uncharacterized protein PV09_02763 [Verruconis gallopava]KIW06296.1 hypothetical protein PV09_02763 [Verruconis gallopava]